MDSPCNLENVSLADTNKVEKKIQKTHSISSSKKKQTGHLSVSPNYRGSVMLAIPGLQAVKL